MDTIGVLDFGGQYTHLIANRIRRLGVFSRIFPSSAAAGELNGLKGIILSGSPHSVLEAGRPSFHAHVLAMGVPVLGLCYGHQLMAQTLGGEVKRGEYREYGRATMRIVRESPLLKGLSAREQIWMSHGDTVAILPPGFEVLAQTDECPVAAMGDSTGKRFGLQFHPEVTDTIGGMTILDNFLSLCGCAREWNASAFLDDISAQIEQTCRGKKVFLLVSGGVDSTVCFALLNRILGPRRVLGLHIDNGLMRHDESEQVMAYLREHGFDNLRIENASEDFLCALQNVCDPERKRAIIGNKFLEVKQRCQDALGLNTQEWLLGQGTIYPDTIESAGTQHADRIKTHHNRVDVVLELLEKGLVVEPLAALYKDEVRMLGEALGLPHSLVWRHPFPGPGLGVRVLCSNGVLEPVDAQMCVQVEAIASRFGYRSCVLPVRSVGVQGDSRTYAHPAVLDGVRNWEALEEVSTLLTNGVRGINRVVYRLSGTGNHRRPVAASITAARLERLRRIDHAATQALRRRGEYETIWQMPVVLVPVVNESGAEAVVLRPVKSQEAMTARFAPLSDETIGEILAAAADVEGIGDILIDVTHKPPGTIEWE